MQRCTATLLAAIAAAFAVSPVRAQTAAPPAPPTTPLFPFVIPWNDATGGVATDMSYLSPHPAGDDGYVVARNGHFVTAKNGERIRFLGTNFTFASNFPTHEDAKQVAAHLRKLGINIVRIHHHDADYGKLWDRKYPDHRHIDAESRDRLDYLIYQFKRNGIYVDLNLHVSREFTPEDGFPASVKQLKDYDKRVDYFEPKMIALQKEFARDYLAHVNPYTKKSYCEDPCVALIEINNENSLVSDAGSRLAGELVDLPEPFRGELVGQWNDWLAARYHTDAALASAWSAGAAPLGKNLLADGASKWTIEHQGDADATLTPIPAASGDGPTGATIDVSKIDATAWHVQAHFTGLTLTEGGTYTASFRARVPDGAPTRSLTVGTALDQPDWHNTGLSTSVKVGPVWKTYRDYFAAQNVVPGHCRLSFGLGNQAGIVQIEDVSLQPGVPAPTAGAATSLAHRNIDLPESATTPERADWVHFLADTERHYADDMRGFLKNDLHTHASILCSQIMWGDSAGLYREANMDFADGHAYWEHPSFPHKPWDPADWRIGDRPMMADLPTGGGTLLRLAEYRVADKPYTITEYNEPAPNDFQCETVPELAAFAAAQDWDAIFLFDWGSYGTGEANDKIQSYFGIGSNPAKTAFLPAAALIFRAGEIKPERSSFTLNLPQSNSLNAYSLGSFWSKEGNPTKVFLSARLQTTLTSSGIPNITPTVGIGGGPIPSPDVLARRAGATQGYLGGTDVTVGTAKLHIDSFGDNFCAVTVTPLPRAYSPTLATLITLVGRVENEGMVWNAAHDSVGTNWGHGPTKAEFIPATITLPAAPKAHVWALDATGKRTHELPVTRTNGKVTFQTDPANPSVWYEVGML